MSALLDAPAATRSLWDDALHAAVDSLDPGVRRVAAYHLGWTGPDGTPTGAATGGKSLRPRLALLSARAAGGTGGDGVPAAVAVELLHNFTLLHDDVMDRDRQRRHRPAAWTVFGTGPAILAGDALLLLASDVLDGRGRARRALAACTHRLIAGQAADLAYERDPDVGVAAALAMAGEKTGSLLGCAAGLGAVWLGAPDALVARLRSFGEHLGAAFQLTDDLLGIWGDPLLTGKPVLADLAARKRSAPVVAALRSGTPAGRELAALYATPGPLGGPALRRAAELLERTGARDWARGLVDHHLARAVDQLADSGVPGPVAAELAGLCRAVAGRGS